MSPYPIRNKPNAVAGTCLFLNEWILLKRRWVIAMCGPLDEMWILGIKKGHNNFLLRPF
jgi:hypothetical protein